MKVMEVNAARIGKRPATKIDPCEMCDGRTMACDMSCRICGKMEKGDLSLISNVANANGITET